MSLTLLISMLLAFAFSISIAVAIGGSAMLGLAIYDPARLVLARVLGIMGMSAPEVM